MRKHLRWILLYNRVTGLQACNFIKARLRRRRYPVIIAKFPRTAAFLTGND